MLGRSLQSEVQLTQGFKQYDPKAALTQLDQRIATAKGGAGKETWFEQGTARLPTLAAADAQIAQLKQEIDQKTQQIKTLDEKRNEALRQAEKLVIQSGQQKGAESVQTYKQSSDMRKKASDLGQEAELIEAGLRPQREQLALVEAQQKVVSEAITTFEKQRQAIQTAWKQIQDRSGTQADAAKKLYAGGAFPTTSEADQDGRESIQQLADQLAKHLSGMQSLGDEAETHLKAATEQFKKASESAKLLGQDLQKKSNDERFRNAPEKKAWEDLNKLFNPLAYSLDIARAQRLLGDLKTNQARLLKTQAQVAQLLSPAVETAGLPALANLGSPAELDAKSKEAFVAAENAYKVASDALNNVNSGGTATVGMKNQAQVLQMLLAYDQSLLAQAQGDTQKAAEMLSASRQLSASLVLPDANIPVPLGLPSEIAPPATMPAAVPSTMPAPAATPDMPAPTSAPVVSPRPPPRRRSQPNSAGSCAPRPLPAARRPWVHWSIDRANRVQRRPSSSLALARARL